ncbi:hypothetical protein [Sphingomonas adhaesiva]|uniref:hypothetical protein n=1 Tax=Sphingomonas adhaesiva TaxID=28212 RepID=UPI002FFC42BF
MAAILEQTKGDLVLVQFDLPIANGPVGISLATRGNILVEWHADVQSYLAKDDGVIELLSDTHRWSVRPRHRTRTPALAGRRRSDARPRTSRVGFHPRRGQLLRRDTDGGGASSGVTRHDSR